MYNFTTIKKEVKLVEKNYRDFEDFKKDFILKIEKARKEIKEGKGIEMKEALLEMEEKYGL